MNNIQNGIIAVDGASGYVGSHLIHELGQRGAKIRAVLRPEARDSDCSFLERCGAEIFKTELDANSDKLSAALTGASVAVHLIGSIAPRRGVSLQDLHAGQTKQLVDACRKSGTGIIMVTALGTAADAESLYHRTKWQAEEILRKSGLPYLILQPSLIIGRQVGSRDSKLMTRYIRLIREKSRVPLIGGGKNLVQPVFIGDLTKLMVKAIFDHGLNGETMEIGGGQVLSMKELVEMLMDVLETRKPVWAVPPALAHLAAGFMEMLQPVPLISRDQIKISSKDNVCKENALQTVFNLSPTELAEALSGYKYNKEKANV